MHRNLEVRLPEVIARRLFIISDYQRPYSWGEKQLSDLWEDLDLVGPGGSHFAGTLILRAVANSDGRPDSRSDGESIATFEVVDGQQRLTTCFLLLDRIRRRLQRLEGAESDVAQTLGRQIRDSYGFVSVDGVERPRLKLGTSLNEYWTDCILGDRAFYTGQLIAGQRLLKDATKFFDRKLDQFALEVSSDTALARLADLFQRVTAGLGFLEYEVTSSADVGMIFETVNERGRGLTELEKTKNYLLYLARNLPDGRNEELVGEINLAWSEIFQNLAGKESNADNTLLRAHWLATVDPDARRWEGVASIKRRFDRSTYIATTSRLIPETEAEKDQTSSWMRLHEDLQVYISTLRDCSWILAESYESDPQFESFDSDADRMRAQLALGALDRTRTVAPFRPLMFASRLAFPADGAFHAQLLELCENYAARVFVIEQHRANTGGASLARIAFELFTKGHYALSEVKAEALKSDTLNRIAATLWRYAPDERIQATLNSTSEDWYSRAGHKYFLYEYERGLWGDRLGLTLPDFTVFSSGPGSENTTEHILPQHPRRGHGWRTVFDSASRLALTHSLGNLLLTLDNSHYSDKPFSEKRGNPGDQSVTYANGRLHQEREMTVYERWTPETIMDRQAKLASWALGRWAVAAPESPLPGEHTVEPGSEDEEDISETLPVFSD